ncbi:MAG: RNA-guided endonuclease InsQ/TnpB family protein [Candidatus Izemoplasmataceae bacterium]
MRYKAIKTKLYLSKNDQTFLRLLMRASKSLYNEALYNVRQHFFETGDYLSYNENYKLLSKQSEHYRILSTTQGQNVIRKVDEAMKAFFGSLKSKTKQKVRLPRYLDKLGYYSLVDRMVYKPKSAYYVMPRGHFIKKVSKYLQETSHKVSKYSTDLQEISNLHIKIDTPKCISNKEIKEITIKPKYDGQYIEVIHVYIDDEENKTQTKKTETMAIDFGYNNLATCAVTNYKHLLLDGLKLKSMNQRYSKKISRLASLRPSQNVLTKRMIHLIEKRNNQMNYGINKAARLIITHALENNVGEIVIGYNDSFKDMKISKKINQWFKSIPIARLRDRIVYLAKQYEIKTTIVNESYTSIASYIDQDPFKKSIFSGKRIKRGLYKSKEGIMINADLNAALNILRKSKPDAKRIGSKGWNTPKRTFVFS